MTRTLLLILLIVAYSPTELSAQNPGVLIHDGFITGNDYRTFSDSEKRRYVIGVVDGLFLAPLLDAPKQQVAWVEQCLTGMHDTQVVAIVQKYLNDSPQRWHEGMHGLVYSALRVGCKASR